MAEVLKVVSAAAATRVPTVNHGKKPPECMICAFNRIGYGYAKDWVGKDVKAAFLFSAPSKDDVVEGVALGSAWGHFILNNYIYPMGLSKDNLILSNVLRCYPPWDRKYMRPGYPKGELKGKCESTCRMYDTRALATFNPNIFLLTFDPHDATKIGAYVRQIQADLMKVKGFIKEGLRPLVLFGNEAAELYFPHIVGNGSVKTWRGHFAEMEFKWKGKV